MADASAPPDLLLVEDDAPLRRLLVRELGERGFSVIAADGVPEARKVIDRRPFDVEAKGLRLPARRVAAPDIRVGAAIQRIADRDSTAVNQEGPARHPVRADLPVDRGCPRGVVEVCDADPRDSFLCKRLKP